MKQLGTAYETNDDAIEKNIMVLILSLNGLF